ncbi:MAG: DUF2892 domain-containing protein [Gammaproteobacteria bacterium]|nr:DUF2892 domain-containing protein [Gammaproteobacteria bacterium]
MNKLANIGQFDKIARIVAGILLVGVSLQMLGGLATTLGLIALIVGVVLIATAVINFCPAYKLLGLSTLARAGKED